MLGSWIESPELADEPHRRASLPYAVFVSGIVLGVMVSIAAGISGNGEPGTEGARAASLTPSSSDVPEESNAITRRASSLQQGWTAPRVTYFVVDSGTRASVLAEAMSNAASDGVHLDFVIVGDEDKSQEVPGMRVAMHELSQSGALVQMVDLR
jgi:hypothetical protein